MKDGLRFVDSDMHIMEPPDLFERYLDPAFKHRVTVQVGADGRPKRGPAGTTVIDGLPTSDMDLQQYRKRVRRGDTQSTQLLSGSRIFDTGRLDFAIERDYNPEAQVMGMKMEGVDIAVLYPTSGLALIARDNLDPLLSLALCQAYNNWIHEFCRHSPDQLKFVAMLPVHDVHMACRELVRCVRELGAVGSFIRPNLVNDRYWHSNYWDPLYAVHEELGVTWGFHEGVSAVYSRMIPLYGENRFYRHVASHWIEMQQAMIAMIIGGVFEFHPKLQRGVPRSAELVGARAPDPHRVGLSAVPRLPRPLPLAHAEGVLPAQLLGRGRGQRAGDRGDGRADRRRSHVRVDGLPALRLELPPRVGEPARRTCRARSPPRSSPAARTSTASPRPTSGRRTPRRPRSRRARRAR